MIRRKTSALVESGILAAIAVIFTLIGNYVPVVDLVVAILWPLPFILCGRRNGLMWNILCLLVTGVLIAILLSPLQALMQVLVLGISGLAIGEGMRRQLSPVKVLLLGSAGSLLSAVISVLISYFVMNVNIVEDYLSAIDASARMMQEMSESFGMGSSFAVTADQLAMMKRMLMFMLPTAFLCSAPISAFVNYWAARKFLARLGDYYPWFPPFDHWMLPRGILGLYGAGLALVAFFRGEAVTPGAVVGYTLLYLGFFLLQIQGLSVVLWYVRYRGKPRFLFPLSVLLGFIMPLAAQFLSVLGAYEMVADLRHIRRPAESEKKGDL
jgi:uncharacterized protein YybS (DUF2232 family)